VGHRAGVLKPFTTAQAADVGLTEARLRTAAVRREHHGVYVESFLEPSVDLSLHAAQLVLPDDASWMGCLHCTRSAWVWATRGPCGSSALIRTRFDVQGSGSDALDCSRPLLPTHRAWRLLRRSSRLLKS